jgi:hypothetical protein
MQLYAVETNEGKLFARAATAEAAFKAIVNKVGHENVNMARPATITEQELAHRSNITECAA